MSPRYEPDLTKATAALTVFEKGRYEFAVGEPRSFSRPKRDEDGLEIADQMTVGVRFPVKCTQPLDGGDPSAKGKRSNIELYLGSEGGQGYAKQFMMATLGFPITEKAEDEFNERFAGADWSFDPDTQAVGDVWREATGKRMIAEVDVQSFTNRQTGEVGQRQRWIRYLPVSAA